MDRQWMYILLLVGFVADIRATIDPNEPFMAIGCRDEPTSVNIYVAALNDDIDEPLQFTRIQNAPITTNTLRGVAYDHTGEELYYSTNSGTDPGTVSKIGLDGSNEMEIFSEAGSGLAINPYTNKLIRKKSTWPYSLHISDLDGSNDAEFAGTESTDFKSSLTDFAVFGSRFIATRTQDRMIYTLDPEDGTLIEDEVYDLSDLKNGIQQYDIDLEAGLLYHLDASSSPLIINRLKINDYNATCVESFVDTRDGNTPENKFYATDIAVYGDYVYVTGTRNILFPGLLAFNKYTGDAANVTFDGLPDLDETSDTCDVIYIHDPARIEADRSFAGATHLPLDDGDDSVDNGNYTAPVDMDVPLIIREAFFGGMIADVAVPITGPISDWKLEISFPRQVFKLEIEGCSAEVSQKEQREYGRRKGTDVVIVPTGESRTPPPGEDLKITLIAETWDKVRRMKRGISARFIPTPPPVSITLSCDNDDLAIPPTP